MSKKKSSNQSYMKVRELTEAAQVARDRQLEIYDRAENEKRDLTEAEQAEADSLAREIRNLEQRLRAMTMDLERANPNMRRQAEEIIRDNVRNNVKTEIVLVRDLMMVGDAASGGLVPINVQDILEPLEEGILIHKLGLPMPTGLSGEFVWPVYEMIEATVAGEGVELSDSKIPFSKLTASPERVGVAIPLTNQSITQTNGVIEMIVRKVLPKAVSRLINRVLLSRDLVNGATHLHGPFCGMTKAPETLSAVPTAKELALMKAKVLETGIEGDNLCFTMTKSMAAILEVTPINKDGIFLPILQGGKIAGIPVFTSNEMRDVTRTYKKYSGTAFTDYTLAEGDKIEAVVTSTDEIAKPVKDKIYEVQSYTEYIGLGDWTYQPLGTFGQMRFIVDPYSKARKDSVDFVLNADFGTKTLRPEAFLLGKVAKS